MTIALASRPASMSPRRGIALLELLIATGVALGALAVIATALPPVLDVVRAVPEAADLQQRTRGTEAVLADLIASAGAGADLIGEGPLVHAVPAVIPRRVLASADPAGTAWADRLSLVLVEARAALAGRGRRGFLRRARGRHAEARPPRTCSRTAHRADPG